MIVLIGCILFIVFGICVSLLPLTAQRPDWHSPNGWRHREELDGPGFAQAD